MNEKPIIVSKRVLGVPRGPDKTDLLRKALGRTRRQRYKWPEPEDAYVVLNLHFSVKSFSRNSFHADATLEIPTKDGYMYHSIAKGSSTEHDALRSVIIELPNSNWFHHMKQLRVYFKVTGAGMEELYRGYL